MFCTNCGNELKDDMRFCPSCGAPAANVVEEGAAPAAAAVEGAAPPEPVASDMPAALFEATGRMQPVVAQQPVVDQPQASQPEAVQTRKPSLVLIAALALVLLALVGLVAFLLMQQAGRGSQGAQPTSSQQASSQPSSQAQSSSSASSATSSAPTSSAPDPTYRHAAGLLNIDFPADWAPPAVEWGNRNHGSGVYISEGYLNGDPSVIVARFEGMDDGSRPQGATTWGRGDESLVWGISAGEFGMSLRATNMVKVVWDVINGAQYAPALSQAQQAQALHLVCGDAVTPEQVAGLSEAEAVALGEKEITAYFEEKVLPNIRLGEAQAEAASSAGPSSAKFDQAKAEADARAAAEAAGKTILEGTIHAGTEAYWAQLEGLPREPNPGDPSTYVGLVLDAPVTVSVGNPDGATRQEQPFVERSGQYVMFPGTENSLWMPYEGQRVAVAFSEFGAFSDTLGALFSFKGTGERIAPLTEADVNAAASQPSGDYVLADSATKRYSRAELEAMDVHTLFLARNEVFARHGCGFRTQELRDWFASKPWYTESIPAGSYGTEILNDVERENVDLMLTIERERNSPYL